jgi:hypothetical protein
MGSLPPKAGWKTNRCPILTKLGWAASRIWWWVSLNLRTDEVAETPFHGHFAFDSSEALIPSDECEVPLVSIRHLSTPCW